MPTYEYQCEKCEHYFTEYKSMSQMNQPEEEPCPNCKELAVKKVMFTAPSLADPVRIGRIRPDGGFKEVMQKIHANNPGSNISDSRYL